MRPRVAGSARWMSSRMSSTTPPSASRSRIPRIDSTTRRPSWSGAMRRGARRSMPRPVEARGQTGHEQAEVVTGRADDRREALVGQCQEHAGEGVADGLVGHADGRPVGTTAAGHHARHHRHPTDSSSRRRVQPMPAGPVSTTRPRPPSATRRTASASWASSRSRPKNAMPRSIDAACNILPACPTTPHRPAPPRTPPICSTS